MKKPSSREALMPERALRLNGPSLEIVERCDGQHTVQQIIVDLQRIISKAEPHKSSRTSLAISPLCKKEARSRLCAVAVPIIGTTAFF